MFWFRSACCFVLAAFALVGCSTPSATIRSTVVISSVPESGQQTIARVGTAVLIRSGEETIPAIDLRSPAQGGGNVIYPLFTVQPQRLVAIRETAEWRTYAAKSVSRGGFSIPTTNAPGGLIVSKVDGRVLVWAHAQAFSVKSPADFVYTNAVVSAGFRQELIYAGAADGRGRFVYRETLPNNQTVFSMEPSQRAVPGEKFEFKGAVVELKKVLEAEVEYTVLQTFTDPILQ